MNDGALDHALLLKQATALPPSCALDWLRDRGDVGSLLPALAEQIEHMAISDLDQALQSAAWLTSVSQIHGSQSIQSRSRRARAHVLAYANRFDDALVELDEAALMAERAGETLEAARVSLTRLHVLARLGRFDDALRSGIAARESFRALGQHTMVAKADANLGVVHRMRDQPREALARFDAARSALHEEPVALAQIESNRAEALLELHRFDEAQLAFESALRAFERAGMKRAAAIVEGNLADLMNRQGRLERALTYFERARRQLEAENAPGDAARLAAEHAETLAQLGLLHEALSAFHESTGTLQKLGLAHEAARSLAGRARVRARLGDFSGAAHDLDQAAQSFIALKHTTGLGRTRLLQGELAWLQYDRGQTSARADTQQALLESQALIDESLRYLHDRPADQALAHLRLARVCLAIGDSTAGLTHLENALARARSLNLAPLLAEAQHLQAAYFRALGQTDAAIAAVSDSIAQIERMRGSL